MQNNNTQEKIADILSRGIDTCIDPDDNLKEKLTAQANGEYDDDIIVKFGVDPTRPDIHLGHAVVFRKLRQLQDIGCKVVFLVGDFTALIGDPTGKSKVRPEIEQKQIEENMQTFIKQVGKILNTDKTIFSWIRNSDWFLSISDIAPGPDASVTQTITQEDGEEITLDHDPNSFIGSAIMFDQSRMQRTHLNKDSISNITLRGLLWTLRQITHSQLIDRDMFQERFDNDDELYMHEMMYPVLQGIDSHVIGRIYGSCDLEIGGSDQMFNMMLARDVMKMNDQAPQAVMTTELLVGTDGNEKMSKSLDNYIAITDDPHEMYGKVMSIPDDAIVEYFRLATYTSLDEVKDIEEQLNSDTINPKDIKMRLAKEITAEYYGTESAEEAADMFNTAFAKQQIPDDIPKANATSGDTLMELTVTNELVSSKSQFRRLVDQGAIENMTADESVDDHHYEIKRTSVFRIGKKRFLKAIVE